MYEEMAALNLLVGQPVEGPGQAAHAGTEGQVGVGEGGANQVGGVGGHVTSLVVTGGGGGQTTYQKYINTSRCGRGN